MAAANETWKPPMSPISAPIEYDNYQEYLNKAVIS